MSSNSCKSRCLISRSKSFEDWLKFSRIWSIYTELPKSCHSPALVLSIKGEARDAASEIWHDEIPKENGVHSILHYLDRLFVNYSTITNCQTLEVFETFNVWATYLFNHFWRNLKNNYLKQMSQYCYHWKSVWV